MFSVSAQVYFIFVRLLNKSPPGSMFVGLCFAVRSVEAVGTSAYLTASYAIVAKTFYDRAASMLVGQLDTLINSTATAPEISASYLAGFIEAVYNYLLHECIEL